MPGKNVDGTRELSIKSPRTETGPLLISVTNTGVACLRSMQTRLLMLSLPPSLTALAWDFGSAAPSFNRLAVGCGLPITLRAVQAFVSPYLPMLPDFTGGFAGKEFVARALPSAAIPILRRHLDMRPSVVTSHTLFGKYTPSIHNVSSPRQRLYGEYTGFLGPGAVGIWIAISTAEGDYNIALDSRKQRWTPTTCFFAE